MEKLGVLSCVILSNVAPDFLYICSYTHMHGFRLLDDWWGVTASRSLDCPDVPEMVPARAGGNTSASEGDCVRSGWNGRAQWFPSLLRQFRALTLCPGLLSGFSLDHSS